jgi:hypothetical protein
LFKDLDIKKKEKNHEKQMVTIKSMMPCRQPISSGQHTHWHEQLGVDTQS